MFVEGQIYNRGKDIHAKFGGQRQGGISTPSSQPHIFLFTGESGEAFGYSDGAAEDGTFRYFGEGQLGDMAFVRGNKAILEHAENGKSLFLFRTLGKGKGIRFMGELGLAGWEHQPAPDANGDMRQAIVFKLVPLDAGADELLNAPPPSTTNLEELRQKALGAAKVEGGTPKSGSSRSYYERSKAVRDYVLARAKGVCENCDRAAPFVRSDGSPYLEPHHIRRVSDGGPDHPSWVAAVCPNCHREIHHGGEGAAINAALEEKILGLENRRHIKAENALMRSRNTGRRRQGRIDWTTLLKEVIPSPCDDRPFVCEGFPSASNVIVIGENPGTPLHKDWWSYWDAETGFNYGAFLVHYERARGKAKGTRARLNRIRKNGVKCIETNVYRNENPDGAGKGEKNSDLVRLLIANNENLQAIIAHGEKAKEFLKDLALPDGVRAYKTKHFTRVRYSELDRICADIKST